MGIVQIVIRAMDKTKAAFDSAKSNVLGFNRQMMGLKKLLITGFAAAGITAVLTKTVEASNYAEEFKAKWSVVGKEWNKLMADMGNAIGPLMTKVAELSGGIVGGLGKAFNWVRGKVSGAAAFYGTLAGGGSADDAIAAMNKAEEAVKAEGKGPTAADRKAQQEAWRKAGKAHNKEVEDEAKAAADKFKKGQEQATRIQQAQMDAEEASAKAKAERAERSRGIIERQQEAQFAAEEAKGHGLEQEAQALRDQAKAYKTLAVDSQALQQYQKEQRRQAKTDAKFQKLVNDANQKLKKSMLEGLTAADLTAAEQKAMQAVGSQKLAEQKQKQADQLLGKIANSTAKTASNTEGAFIK